MSKFAPHRRGTSNPVANASTVCQRCLGKGHFTYECKSSRPYVSRPSRTQLLEKPNLLSKLRKEGQPSNELPEEFKTKAGTANKILEDKERQRDKEKGQPPKKKARKSSRSTHSKSESLESSSSDSSTNSDSDSDSDSGSLSDSTSSSESSRSRSKDNKRRRSRRSPS